VDLVPCPHLKDALGNPQDVVEIRADLVVNVVCGDASNDMTYRQRIDWWLDEGGDEYGLPLLLSPCRAQVHHPAFSSLTQTQLSLQR
jgi:hypothetical protein